jgi:hypothetical protein
VSRLAAADLCLVVSSSAAQRLMKNPIKQERFRTERFFHLTPTRSQVVNDFVLMRTARDDARQS